MDVASIISDIQENHCRPCKYGTCLIALKKLLDANEADETQPKAVKSGSIRSKPVKANHGASKACNKCGKTKPLEEYPKNAQCVGGRAGTCKECHYNRHRKNYLKRHAVPKSVPEPAVNIESDDEEKLECKLCHALCATPERLERHILTVHGRA